MERTSLRRDRQLRKLKNQLHKHKMISRCNGVALITDIAAVAALNHYNHVGNNNTLMWLCVSALFMIATGQIFNEYKQGKVESEINRLQNSR